MRITRDLEINTQQITNEFSLEGIIIINDKFEIQHIDEQLKFVLGFDEEKIKFNFFKNTTSEFRLKLTQCISEKSPSNFRQFIREREKWFKCYVLPFENKYIIHFNELSYLLDLEHKFSALLDSTADFNVLLDLDYRIVSFNKSSEIFAKEVLQKEVKNGDLILDYFPLPEQESLRKDLDNASLGNFFTYKKKVIYNEVACWFNVTLMPYYFNNSTQIKGISFNSVDITTIVNSEENVAEKEKIINEIFSSTQESYLFISNDLKVLYKNDAVDLIYPIYFGALPKIGENALSFIQNEKQEEFNELLQRALKGDTIQFHRNDGLLFWRILIFPVFNNLGTLIGVVIRIQDISTQKLNEKKITEQNNKLEEIAWHHSHILRKPLANIFGIYNVLLENEMMDEKLKENYLVHLHTAAKELDEVIQDVVKSIRQD